MNDAFGIVERFVVDHEPRMRRALEQAHQFAERNVALDRDDVGAMHHHVGDAPLVQAEDVAQHGALDGGKADLVRRARRRARPEDRRGPIPAFQPNSVRIARSSQLSAAGRSTSPSCTTAGRLARVARIVVGRVGVRHFSPSAPGRVDPHRDRECRAARESPVRDLPWLRRRRRSRDRSRSDAGSRAPQDG